jgi:oligoribonuclease NrnB/cAMP/cGMP phosphodiesterase (DHH superfamily)
MEGEQPAMKCFYHDDMDGKCAGAIVHKFYKVDRDYTKEMGEECEFLRINYKDEFPFDDIKPGETIVIVDFSLQKEGEFQKLLAITENVIWIDHHKTAIEKHGDLNVRGIRRDGTAGCELTWEFFYPNIAVPPVVKLLGDYDVWAFKYGEDTNKLQTGIRLYKTSPTSEEWLRWLDPKYHPAKELEKGQISLKYRDNYYAGLVKSWSFFTEFEGHKVIACNAGSVSSQLFDSVSEDYDIMMPFVFDGKQWTVSLYTKKDIDVSEIAKKYGGGGHKKAAGFQCKELPFRKVE